MSEFTIDKGKNIQQFLTLKSFREQNPVWDNTNWKATVLVPMMTHVHPHGDGLSLRGEGGRKMCALIWNRQYETCLVC